MLVEVRCDKFREGVVPFHAGLNVVVGDEKATNSIGKSSLLMVVDYVFGGNSLLEHNGDIVDALGHHDYCFHFRFNGKDSYFKRSTYTPELVCRCSDKYEDEQPLTIDEFRAFLKSSYCLDDIDLTFRGTVSLYSRIWGKDNYDVKQPLHVFKSSRSSDCIDTFLSFISNMTLSNRCPRKLKSWVMRSRP